jgi:hypothetical protein
MFPGNRKKAIKAMFGKSGLNTVRLLSFVEKRLTEGHYEFLLPDELNTRIDENDLQGKRIYNCR